MLNGSCGHSIIASFEEKYVRLFFRRLDLEKVNFTRGIMFMTFKQTKILTVTCTKKIVQTQRDEQI